MSRSGRVAVVTGAGGMGEAIARRVAAGRTLVLADVNPSRLAAVVERLTSDGYDVVGVPTDVSDAGAVGALAAAAAERGRVEVVVHTAGVSPVQAPVAAVLNVDLLGTALMLDAFAEVVADGGAGVFISSMSGAMVPLD